MSTEGVIAVMLERYCQLKVDVVAGAVRVGDRTYNVPTECTEAQAIQLITRIAKENR